MHQRSTQLWSTSSRCTWIVEKKHFRVERAGLGSDAIASGAAVRKRKWWAWKSWERGRQVDRRRGFRRQVETKEEREGTKEMGEVGSSRGKWWVSGKLGEKGELQLASYCSLGHQTRVTARGKDMRTRHEEGKNRTRLGGNPRCVSLSGPSCRIAPSLWEQLLLHSLHCKHWAHCCEAKPGHALHTAVK